MKSICLYVNTVPYMSHNYGLRPDNRKLVLQSDGLLNPRSQTPSTSALLSGGIHEERILQSRDPELCRVNDVTNQTEAECERPELFHRSTEG